MFRAFRSAFAGFDFEKVARWSLRLASDRDDANDLAQEVFVRVQERLHTYRGEAKVMQQVRDLTERRSAAGQGAATLEPGLQLHALLGGAVGACGLFLLAAVAAHRRWWSKLLGLLVLGLVIAVVPAWVYREEWGIAEYIPREVKDLMPF